MGRFHSIVFVLAAVGFAQAPSIYEQAASSLQRGDAPTAIRLLEPRLHDAPNDLRALTLMGMALSSQDRREEGNEYFRRVLSLNPAFPPALRNLGLNQMASGNSVQARRYIEELLKLTPADAVGRLALAELEFTAGHHRAALTNYEQSAELYLRDPPNLLRYAQSCIELKQAAKAVTALEQMPRGADPQSHFAAGGLLAKLERYVSAVREFELARNGYPNPYDAAFNLMLAHVKAGQFQAAVKIGEEVAATGDRHAELYNLLSQAYEGAGNTREAYESLRKATTIEPADPVNYLDLIALCISHRNYDLALEIADLSLVRIPESGQLHLQRGIVLAMKENFEGAKSEFESAIKLAPERSLSHVALGLMLLQMDRPAEAVSVLRRHARTSRDYLTLWFLGEALNREGPAEGSAAEREAVSALVESVRLKPDVAQSRILLAKLLAHQQQLDAAEKQLAAALQLEPDNVSATYQLAQVLRRKGETERAKELFAKVSKAKAEDREQFTKGSLQHIIRVGSRVGSK
jgi:tetratricopeptide (TPR) repeat protein